MPVNAHEFIRIVTHPVIEKFKPRIVVGGPGAWQLEKANRLDEFKIDYLIDGEIERVFKDLFRRILSRDPTLPRIVKIPKDMQPPVEEIPVVRHRSTFGVCEITRGCGRGCQFCSPATKIGRSFPLEHIIASAEVNAREGATEVMLASEDMFLYEQLPNFETNVPALENLAAVPGIETIQTSHITIAPVVKDLVSVLHVHPWPARRNGRRYKAVARPALRPATCEGDVCADVLCATRKHTHGTEGQREADRDDGSSVGVLLHVLEVQPGVLAQWQ